MTEKITKNGTQIYLLTEHKLTIHFNGDQEAIFIYKYGNPVICVHRCIDMGGKTQPSLVDTEFNYYDDLDFIDALYLLRIAQKYTGINFRNDVVKLGLNKEFVTWGNDVVIDTTDVNGDVVEDLLWNISALMYFYDIFILGKGVNSDVDCFAGHSQVYFCDSKERDRNIEELIESGNMSILWERYCFSINTEDINIYSKLIEQEYAFSVCASSDRSVDYQLTDIKVPQLIIAMNSLFQRTGQSLYLVKNEIQSNEKTFSYELFLDNSHVISIVGSEDEDVSEEYRHIFAEINFYYELYRGGNK